MKVLEALRKLHDEIKKMTGLEDDEFWIEVTGGDREKDRNGNIRSSTTKELEKDPDVNPESAHLIERGARALDFKFSANLPKELITSILKSDPEYKKYSCYRSL